MSNKVIHQESSLPLTSVQLEIILDSIDEAIVGCDKDGYINIYNRANERREKTDRKQILHHHVDKIYDFHSGKSLLMAAIKTKKPILDQYQEYTVQNSGTLLEVICSTVPVMENGKIVGAVSVMKDYSKVKKLSRIITDLQSSLYSKNAHKENSTRPARHSLFDIIGKNNVLENTIKWAGKAAENDLPVMIFGETGTGKELLAQGIHNAGARHEKPFIAINCAAIPENLLESLLFGTTKGAFTGAIDRPGLFEKTSGGTLVLDEINSMPLPLQSKLLRVVQEEAVLRVGDTKEKRVDTRIISISNEDPAHAVKLGQLREDLYYRLAYITLSLPPLKERLDDLPLLIDFIINKYNKRLNCQVKKVSSSLYGLLETYPWPGNIRELEHVLAAGMSYLQDPDEEITLDHLPPNIQHKLAKKYAHFAQIKDSGQTLEQILNRVEKRVVKQTLERHSGNVSRAARELGLKRQSLQYRINKYSLRQAP